MANTAIVIGGTRRTGRWVSEALCIQGLAVHAVYRTDTSAAERCVAELDQAGYQLQAHQADATQAEALAEVIGSIAAAAGGCSVLVNCAGTAGQGSILGTSAAQVTEIWGSNVLTVHNAVQAAVPYLRLSGSGRIINFLSIGTDTQRAFRSIPIYAASKAMLASYSRSLARELAPAGITVNCLALGATALPPENVPGVEPESLPTGTYVSQEDIAAAVWYLTGPGSNQLTGSVLNLSGGWAL